jgi:hypothetical protein
LMWTPCLSYNGQNFRASPKLEYWKSGILE